MGWGFSRHFSAYCVPSTVLLSSELTHNDESDRPAFACVEFSVELRKQVIS